MDVTNSIPTAPGQVDPKVGGPYSAPRGGKYVSRKWNHDAQKWEYEYRADAGHKRGHGNVPIADSGDDYHTTSFDVDEGEEILPPNELYRRKRDKFLTTSGEHKLNFENLGEITLSIEDKKVSTNRKKYTHLYTAKDATGNVIAQSPELAEVELTLHKLDQSETMEDDAGNLIATIVPQIGFVSTEEIAQRATLLNENIRRDKKPERGIIPDLIPAERPHLPIPKWGKPGEENRGIYYSVYDADGKKWGLFKNMTTAKRAVAKRYNITYEEPSEEKQNQFKDLDFTLRNNYYDKYTTQKVGKGRGRARLKRILTVPPEEKDALINQAIKENFNAIWMSARLLAKNPTIVTLFSPDDQTSTDTDYIATQLLTGGKDSSFVPTRYEKEMSEKAGQEIPIKVEKDTPIYRAVNDAIDQYGMDGRSLQNIIIGKVGGSKSGKTIFHGKLSREIRGVVNEKEKEHGFVRRYDERASGSEDDAEAAGKAEKTRYQSGAYAANPEDQYIDALDESGESSYSDSDSDSEEYGDFSDEESEPEVQTSSEPEDLSSVDIPHDAPEVAEWTNHQIQALNRLASDYDTDSEKAVIAEQFYQALVRTRKNMQKMPELIRKMQSLMDASDIGDYYVHVTPFLNKIVKKAITFINIDLNKSTEASSPQIRLKAEPNKDEHPNFFTPGGKKLSRAIPEDREVSWNSKHDPKNPERMWIAKWFDDERAEDSFTYLLDDLEAEPKYKQIVQITNVASQIEEFRELYTNYIASESEKDRVTGLVLALLDQGYFDLETLLSLTVDDVQIHTSVITLGKRTIYPTNGIYDIILSLLDSAEPEQPFFVISGYPVGPSYINSILDAFGLAYTDLKYYQINKLFLFRLAKAIEEGLSFDDAVIQSVKNVSAVMGYGKKIEKDALFAFMTSLLSEVIIKYLDEIVEDLGVEIEAEGKEISSKHFIPLVDGALSQETDDEKEFHKFLYDIQLHRY